MEPKGRSDFGSLFGLAMLKNPDGSKKDQRSSETAYRRPETGSGTESRTDPVAGSLRVAVGDKTKAASELTLCRLAPQLAHGQGLGVMTFLGKGEKRRSGLSRWAGYEGTRPKARDGRGRQTSRCKKAVSGLQMRKVDECSFLAPCPVYSLAYDHWR